VTADLDARSGDGEAVAGDQRAAVPPIVQSEHLAGLGDDDSFRRKTTPLAPSTERRERDDHAADLDERCHAGV
jgi:hypothetical protein